MVAQRKTPKHKLNNVIFVVCVCVESSEYVCVCVFNCLFSALLSCHMLSSLCKHSLLMYTTNKLTVFISSCSVLLQVDIIPQGQVVLVSTLVEKEELCT